MLLWMDLALTVGVCVLATLATVLLLRASRRLTPVRGTSDVEGVYVTTIATLYGILMAFMIFVVWTRYYDALSTVEQEADTLGDVYRLSTALPQPYRDMAQRNCLEYAHYMVKVEWAAMQQGKDVPRPTQLLDDIWDELISSEKAAITDNVLRDHLMTSIVQLTSLRRSRLLQARTGLPNILYVVLIFGATVTVGLATLFATEDLRAHALKACALAALVSLTLFTIWALDYPFDGMVSIPPDAFERTIRILSQAQQSKTPPTPGLPGPQGAQNASESARH